MSAAIFSPVGIKAGFYASNIVHKIVNKVISHQVKQSSLSHKVNALTIIGYWIFITIKMIKHPTIFILAIYFVCTNSQKCWDTLQHLRVSFNNGFKFRFNVFRANQRVQNIQFDFDSIDVSVNFIKIYIVSVICDTIAEIGHPYIEIS